MKGGTAQASHAHADQGSFVLDALGERWAEDGSGNGSGGSGGSAGSGSASSQTQEEAAQSLITWLEGRIANLDRLINERAGE